MTGEVRKVSCCPELLLVLEEAAGQEALLSAAPARSWGPVAL
jgi:hypothetical protein